MTKVSTHRFHQLSKTKLGLSRTSNNDTLKEQQDRGRVHNTSPRRNKIGGLGPPKKAINPIGPNDEHLHGAEAASHSDCADESALHSLGSGAPAAPEMPASSALLVPQASAISYRDSSSPEG